MTSKVPVKLQWATIATVATSVLIAAYTGARIPSVWTTTLQAVSITDGFHKRFLVGTALRPFAIATRFDYWYFSLFSALVLLCLISILVYVVLRTKSYLVKSLIVCWLVLPTGGFLFHTIGYFEHVIYLLFFVASWLVAKSKPSHAALVVALTPLVHEISLLTVVPLFVLVLAYHMPLKRLLLFAVPATIVNLIVLVIPAASSSAVSNITPALQGANFQYRIDALLVFQRTHAENRKLYDLGEQIAAVFPVALILVVGFAVYWHCRKGAVDQPRSLNARLVLVFSLGSIAAPALLALGGWDSNRWIFFIVSNFVIAIVFLENRRPSQCNPASGCLVLVLLAAFISRVPIYYFDKKQPRELRYVEVKTFVNEVRDGRFWQKPSM